MKYLYLTLAAIWTIVLIAIAINTVPVQKIGDAGSPNYLNNTTNTSVALTTNTSTLVLPASYGRLYVDICSVPTNTTSTFLAISSKQNASGTTIGVPATLNNGIYLATGTCYVINTSNLLVGLINAYANASNTLSVIYQ